MSCLNKHHCCEIKYKPTTIDIEIYNMTLKLKDNSLQSWTTCNCSTSRIWTRESWRECQQEDVQEDVKMIMRLMSSLKTQLTIFEGLEGWGHHLTMCDLKRSSRAVEIYEGGKCWQQQRFLLMFRIKNFKFSSLPGASTCKYSMHY